jgi:hypothetical protein
LKGACEYCIGVKQCCCVCIILLPRIYIHVNGRLGRIFQGRLACAPLPPSRTSCGNSILYSVHNPESLALKEPVCSFQGKVQTPLATGDAAANCSVRLQLELPWSFQKATRGRGVGGCATFPTATRTRPQALSKQGDKCRDLMVLHYSARLCQ